MQAKITAKEKNNMVIDCRVAVSRCITGLTDDKCRFFLNSFTLQYWQKVPKSIDQSIRCSALLFALQEIFTPK